MINLLLIVVMVLALFGIILCGKGRQKKRKMQFFAVVLLLIVLVSGGIFMDRMNALQMFMRSPAKRGAKQTEILNVREQVLALSVAEYMNQNWDRMPVLLIGSARKTEFRKELEQALNANNFFEIAYEPLIIRKAARDALILPVEDQLVETMALNELLRKHAEARAIILYGTEPTGRSLMKLAIFQNVFLEETPPKLIVILNTGTLDETWAELISQQKVAAVVLPIQESGGSGEKKMPVSALMQERFLILDQSNLERYRALFLPAAGRWDVVR